MKVAEFAANLDAQKMVVDAQLKQVQAKTSAYSAKVDGWRAASMAITADNELQSTRPTTDTIRSLGDFAEYVRHRMAWDPKTEKELYYSAEDVRSFLGGLAMSRLQLLQGISGTGKTSLPLAFARAGPSSITAFR